MGDDDDHATGIDGTEQQVYALYRLDERKPSHAANPQLDPPSTRRNVRPPHR